MLIRSLVILVVAAGVLAGLFFGLSRRYTINSAAMTPTIEHGDQVAVFRFSDWFYSPHRKDIVVFETPAPAARACGTRGALRVIGLPRETVTERLGVVSVDGTRLGESYVKHRDHATHAWHVPRGAYFLMGDSRGTRCDSRSFGAISTRRIVGKVFLTFWPIDRVSIG
jgi:signal peptidase I